jgi:hypothetical protein
MDSRQPSRTQQVIALTIALLTMSQALWMSLPEHERQLIAMRTLARLRGLVARAALGLGLEGMTNELAGRPGVAGQHYSAAAVLSAVRDRLAARIDRMRP